MKIDGINPAGTQGQEPKKSADKVSGASFGSFLQNAMKADQAAPAKPVSGPAPLLSAQMAAAQVKNPFHAEAVNQLESVLGDLELYRNTLATPDVPAKQLGPMADLLMQKKDALVALMGKVDDPQLKDMLSQTAAVILNENSRLYAAV